MEYQVVIKQNSDGNYTRRIFSSKEDFEKSRKSLEESAKIIDAGISEDNAIATCNMRNGFYLLSEKDIRESVNKFEAIYEGQ